MNPSDFLNVNQQHIAEKTLKGERLNFDDALNLYEFDLGILGYLAVKAKERQSGKYVFFNRNLHLEPTNACIYHCRFCSYRANENEKPWLLSETEMLNKIAEKASDITEIHITGGVHPSYSIEQATSLLQSISKHFPYIHIKAFTSTEIAQMCKVSGIGYETGLRKLIGAGLGSLPGGGAEIFDETIRSMVCPDKPDSSEWIALHETAHKLGIKSNATMLYGHIEKPVHRIDHMMRLRNLQDRTGGINAFIPLKFRNTNNPMAETSEITFPEILKNFAVSRLVLDNIPHLKAYWPSIGREQAQMALAFGVDDMDGTINDSTSIYSRAGAEEQNPGMTTDELVTLIMQAGYVPAERDSLYQTLHIYE